MQNTHSFPSPRKSSGMVKDLRLLKIMDKLNRAYVKWILNTWDQYNPEWFVTILWNDLPTDAITAASHTRHLRNKLLCETTGIKRCGNLPDFPDHLGMTVFHERTMTPKGKVTFHTHMHLYNTSSGSAIFSDPQPRWDNTSQLHFLLRYKLGTKIQKLLKSTTSGNEGVVVKRWVKENHEQYNMKEISRQQKLHRTMYAKACKLAQDKDLLLDVMNSDLLTPKVV